jgi:catechol 2,3-dioxygenase-like lactoylglutathione lyase family enzyme
MPIRLAMVTLGVADVTAATAFYRRLGLEPGAESGEAVSFFDMDGIVLALYGRGPLAEDAGVVDAAGGFSGVTLAWNRPSPEAVDAALAQAVAAGGRITRAAEKTFWGGYSGYFADPDGHLWEIAHNPFFPLDENGVVRLPGPAA